MRQLWCVLRLALERAQTRVTTKISCKLWTTSIRLLNRNVKLSRTDFPPQTHTHTHARMFWDVSLGSRLIAFFPIRFQIQSQPPLRSLRASRLCTSTALLKHPPTPRRASLLSTNTLFCSWGRGYGDADFRGGCGSIDFTWSRQHERE